MFVCVLLGILVCLCALSKGIRRVGTRLLSLSFFLVSLSLSLSLLFSFFTVFSREIAKRSGRPSFIDRHQKWSLAYDSQTHLELPPTIIAKMTAVEKHTRKGSMGRGDGAHFNAPCIPRRVTCASDRHSVAILAQVAISVVHSCTLALFLRRLRKV